MNCDSLPKKVSYTPLRNMIVKWCLNFLLLSQIVLLNVFVSHGLDMSKIEPIKDRVPQVRRNFGRKTRLGGTSEAEYADNLGDNDQKNIFVSGKSVAAYNECGKTMTLEEEKAVFIYSKFTPYKYKCVQEFTGGQNGSLIQLQVVELLLRTVCKYESLIIKTDNTTYKFCRSDSQSVPKFISGSSIKLEYRRKAFGSHGGYIFILTKHSTHLTESTESETTDPPPETPAEPSDFIDCFNCGEIQMETRSEMFDRLSVQSRSSRPEANTRIVGGEEAKRGNSPWTVYVAIETRSGSFFSCGGTLVSDSVIVTAAHCLEDSVIRKLHLQFGTIDLEDPETGSKYRTSSNYKIHEDYDSEKIENDIAVIFMDDPIEFTEYIQPACLPSKTLGQLDDLTVTATGWGLKSYGASRTADKLQTVQLKIWEVKKCNEAWRMYGVTLLQSQICAYDSGKDTCSGDSGGPLAIQLQGKWILIGITSYGYKCAVKGLPGVYTRVSKYISWLEQFVDSCPAL